MASQARQEKEPPSGDPLAAPIAWETTPLGPVEQWPERLRFAADLCGRMSSAAAVYWGPDLILLYNRAFAALLRDRHPAALGRPAREVWARLWDTVGPQFAEVLATKRALSVVEQMFTVERDGVPDESYWNYSLTPIVDESGGVAGIFSQREDVTRPVQAQRRLTFQVELADAVRGVGEPSEVKRIAAALLGQYLGVARVGFAEIDEEAGTVLVRAEWTRGPDVPPLGAHRGLVADLGEEAVAYLRSGQVMTIADILPLLPAGEARERWQALGVRSLITVPMVRDGRIKALLFVHEPEPRVWKRSEAAMVRDVAERSWAAVERAQAERSLRESEDHYRHAVELNPQVTWTALPDGRINRVSPRWREWTGTSGLEGSWRGGMHPDDHDATLALWERSLRTGEHYDIEHRVRRPDGSYRWARSRAFPRRAETGEILLWYGTTEDIDERKRGEERQRLLINELNHRVKNTLATVQAIAFQTLRGAVSVADGRALFEARLIALSRAHDLLTEQNWGGAPLETVVRDATEPLGGRQGRFAVSGEPLWLTPRAALALALALHELGTNAAKYGALSAEGGTVSLAWRTTGERLLIEWKEQGGPKVAPPARRGFGTRLIEHGLGADLGGSAHLAFEADGLRCTIDAALAEVTAEAPDGG
ncbi:MAG: HWE histidine kinase domain-containing protein [Allosphingosinicella sp.]